jgi:hypothetical protein
MARNRVPARALITLGSALLIFSGCDRIASHGDNDFARAALERNPDLTVVASDKDANTFTVQVKGSPELRVIRADEVIGTLPSTGVAQAAPTSSETAKATPAPEAAPASESAEPSHEAPMVGEPAQVASRPGSALKPGTGFVTDATGKTRKFGDTEAPAGATAGTSDSQSATTSGATAEKAGAQGKVLAAGPGYSVTAGEPRANRPIHLAEATELKSPSNSVMEKRYDPMICQGSRLIQIDGRNIEFEGDGLSVLDGCELHITNSHIIAHGLGLSVRAANVHIQNSIIEGDGGSVSASRGAKVYTQQSTFKGLSRRLDTASFEDLGGTNWN